MKNLNLALLITLLTFSFCELEASPLTNNLSSAIKSYERAKRDLASQPKITSTEVQSELKSHLTEIAANSSSKGRSFVFKELQNKKLTGISQAAAEVITTLSLSSKELKALSKVASSKSGLDLGTKITLFDGFTKSKEKSKISWVSNLALKAPLETQLVAISSLGHSPKNSEARETLIELLPHRHMKVRDFTLKALKKFRHKDLVSPLIDHIEKEREEKLRLATLKLLMSLTEKNMGYVHKDWQKWWEVAEATFEISNQKEGGTSVKQHDLSYFGIEISSKRISFVVDASHSMLGIPGKKKKGQGGGGAKNRGKRDTSGPPGSKLAIMKKELSGIIAKLPEDTWINIIYFHRSYYSWKKSLYPLKGKGRQEAIQFVQDLKTSLKTNIYDTLEFAIKDKKVDTIYFLSDGQPVGGMITDPGQIAEEIKKQNRLQGITIHTLSFGRASKLLIQLADDSDGTHRLVGGKQRQRNKKGGNNKRGGNKKGNNKKGDQEEEDKKDKKEKRERRKKKDEDSDQGEINS